MSNIDLLHNGVDEAGTNGEGLSPGRCPIEEQGGPGRNHATATVRRKRGGKIDWSDLNGTVMECYILSEPERRGYMDRMREIWLQKGMFEVTKQRLGDQVRQIKKKGWLTDVEIEEIKRKAHGLDNISDPERDNRGDNPETSEGNILGSANEREEEVDHAQEEPELVEEDEVQLKDEELEIAEKLHNIMQSNERERLPSIKKINKKKILVEVQKVNEVLNKIKSNDITTTNDLIYAAAVVVTERLGVKMSKRDTATKEPWWKRRLEDQIKQLRKDIARVEILKNGGKIKSRFRVLLQKKYWLKQKGYKRVIEELKQRIKAKAAKVKRYKNRIEQFRQNRLFQTDQSRLYKELNGEEAVDLAPEKEEAKRFWSDIWSKEVKHNNDAEWLKKIREEQMGRFKQDRIEITIGKVKKVLKSMPNWKSAGPDLVQGFWLKNFTAMHDRITIQLSACLETGQTPQWMTKGRTVLLLKDIKKGNIVSNYRPITCLPLMWKLLTGMIAEDMYTHLEGRGVLPEEQKGCKKGSRGTNDLLYIDQQILREVKRRKKNLATAWIDYKKAYDNVPHSWIQECLRLFGIADNVVSLLDQSMKTWKTELTSGNEVLGEVEIKRGIFQGDTLSPLLFVLAMIPLTLVLRKAKAHYEFTNGEKINHLFFMDDLKLFARNEKALNSLVQTVRVVSEDIGMKFGIEKCAMLVLKRGNITKSDGIVLPDDTIIKAMNEGDSYKYLGIMEADQILRKEMKDKVKKEYFRRTKKVLKSKLNGGNSITAINTWAVSLLRYSAAFLSWTREELRVIDRQTRKMMTMHRALHPRDSVDRLYLPRKEGGRGLISIEDCVDIAELSLKEYVMKSKEKLISAARGSVTEEVESAESYKKRRKEERGTNIWGKELHGQHFRQMKDVGAKESWTWLQKGELKKETEGMIMAAQSQSLRTNAIKARIDKSREDAKCRMCSEKDETIHHIVSGCSNLAQKEYKRRHDCVARALHWDILRQRGFEMSDKWYQHEPESVVENERFKVLWDFTVQTDLEIHARRPDIIIVDKNLNETIIIDVAIPVDVNIRNKEQEKIIKYQDLAREIRKIWNVSTKVIPIVIGALGTVTGRLEQYLKEIGVTTRIELIQKSTLLGTARIIRQVLDI